MDSHPGTYALILQNDLPARIQIGRWGELETRPGYYMYVGSAFGPGGVRARVSRHLRTEKSEHWHIDYLRAFVTPLAVWVSYEPTRLEHAWAQALSSSGDVVPIKGFGCSDCSCCAHLFHMIAIPAVSWLTGRESLYQYSLTERSNTHGDDRSRSYCLVR